MIHADVFRPPEHSLLLLSVLLGSGIQVLLMVFATITLALLGYISPENRGTMINLLLLPVSRRQALCCWGLGEIRTVQQGWGAPWSHPTAHSHQGHPRGPAVLQVCVHLWG